MNPKIPHIIGVASIKYLFDLLIGVREIVFGVATECSHNSIFASKYNIRVEF
jgi:hypothetical protein